MVANKTGPMEQVSSKILSSPFKRALVPALHDRQDLQILRVQAKIRRHRTDSKSQSLDNFGGVNRLNEKNFFIT